MARMRPLHGDRRRARHTVKIEPGGIHLMLVDLESPLVTGKPVPLTLEFRVAGRITVELSVETRDPHRASGTCAAGEVARAERRRTSSTPSH